jgi:hypothetical protein
VGTMANWFFNFLVSLLFYAAMCAFTFWFCRRYVPETKGKHLEEIQAVFQARVKAS